MPHPGDFATAHGAAASKSGAACAKCHKTELCQMCHKGTAPASHTEGFALKHAEVAKAQKAACVLCHGKDFCAVCHP